jgi:ribosomal protein L37AE/L43A
VISCKRGPLFRLLHLERHLCSQCERDILHRPGVYPEQCPWCGAREVSVTIELDLSKFITACNEAAEGLGRFGAAFGNAAKAAELFLRESTIALPAFPPGPLQHPHIHDGR